MKTLKLVLLALLVIGSMATQAQDVDEIIANYFENTGGYAKWGELKNMKLTGKFNQGGMEIPVEIVKMSDGRQYTKIEFQGQVIMQGVFDGETLWGTNFQTMKAEKADEEATEVQKLEANDFPDSFYDYKKKGYSIELVGKEEVEGTETYKVKLVKEPVTIDGEKQDNILYYFFDVESFAIIYMETKVKAGPAKGQTSMAKMSDYQEAGDLYLPFKLENGVKGGPTFTINLESAEVNVEVDESLFTFPEGE